MFFSLCVFQPWRQRFSREHPDEMPRINVFETILKLRCNRPGMVQTKDQFEFCYRAVLEEYLDSEKRLRENGRTGNEDKTAAD